MLKHLPGKFSSRWFLIFFIYTLLLWGILCLSSSFLAGNRLEFENVMGILVFSASLSLVACLEGYFNAKLAFLVSTLAIIIGLGLMISIFADKNKMGWEGLIGVLAFAEIVFIGFGVGLLGELIWFLIKKQRKSKEGKI